MEQVISASHSGTVSEIAVRIGDAVYPGAVLVMKDGCSPAR